MRSLPHDTPRFARPARAVRALVLAAGALALAAVSAGCPAENAPDAVPSAPSAAPDAGASSPGPDKGTAAREPCDASHKPALVVPTTPAACEAAKGAWVDDWPPGQMAGPASSGFVTVGRGNAKYRGCAHVPTTDAGHACRYDWECQGRCTPAKPPDTQAGCSGTFEPDPGFGCEPRCVDGVVQTLCVD